MSMTNADKLAMIKAILRLEDTSEDALLATYLDMAKREILTWRYSNANPENVPDEVPVEYEMTQVQAVINGYTLSGNEGEVVHIENGTHFHFAHTDMMAYIRENVIPVAGVLRASVLTEPEETEPEVTGSEGAQPEGTEPEGTGTEGTDPDGTDGDGE